MAKYIEIPRTYDAFLFNGDLGQLNADLAAAGIPPTATSDGLGGFSYTIPGDAGGTATGSAGQWLVTSWDPNNGRTLAGTYNYDTFPKYYKSVD